MDISRYLIIFDDSKIQGFLVDIVLDDCIIKGAIILFDFTMNVQEINDKYMHFWDIIVTKRFFSQLRFKTLQNYYLF